MADNPYSSSTHGSESAGGIGRSDPPPPVMTLARNVFLAWERLRIIYVLLLLVVTLAMLAPELPDAPTILTMVFGAIAANLCFFAGPIVETYVRWLGYNGIWVRRLLFVGGMLLATALTVMTLATQLLPAQP